MPGPVTVLHPNAASSCRQCPAGRALTATASLTRSTVSGRVLWSRYYLWRLGVSSLRVRVHAESRYTVTVGHDSDVPGSDSWRVRVNPSPSPGPRHEKTRMRPSRISPLHRFQVYIANFTTSPILLKGFNLKSESSSQARDRVFFILRKCRTTAPQNLRRIRTLTRLRIALRHSSTVNSVIHWHLMQQL
jgi:hypothetical protein